MPRPIGKMHELWFGPEDSSVAASVQEPEPDMVFALDGKKKRYVTRERAEQEGWPIDPPCKPLEYGIPESNTYRLSVDARQRIYTQTGQHFEDYGQYKQWCKQNGKRDIEKGEKLDESWRVFSEWTRSGQKGPCPLPATPEREERIKSLSDLHDKMRASGELAQRAERLGLGRNLDRVMRIALPGDA